MRSGRIWPSSGWSRRSDARVSRNCSMLSQTPDDERVPEVARMCLAALGCQLRRLKEQILEFDRLILAWHRSNETSSRLDGSPVSARCWPAPWLPRSLTQRPSARAQLLSLDRACAEAELKRGQGEARRHHQARRPLSAQPVHGRRAWPSFATPRSTAPSRPWLTALLARRPTKVAAIALANKIARMVWAMMARGERYKEPVALAA